MNTIIIALVFIFFILIILFPIPVELKFFFDGKRKFSFVVFRVFGLKLIFSELKVKGKKFFLRSYKSKKETELKFNFEKFDFAKNFSKTLFSNISLRTVDIWTKIGLENPFYVALSSGAFSSCVSGLLMKIQKEKQYARIRFSNKACFFSSCLVMSATTRIFISLFDLFEAYVEAKILTKKERKLYEKRREV